MALSSGVSIRHHGRTTQAQHTKMSETQRVQTKETKDEPVMIETKDDPSADNDLRGEPALLVSAFDGASRGAIIRKFWRVFLIGIAVASAGM